MNLYRFRIDFWSGIWKRHLKFFNIKYIYVDLYTTTPEKRKEINNQLQN